jgi:alkyl sulfatase BDS1-like metallo-beta-lactamase superfamily hydrolase
MNAGVDLHTLMATIDLPSELQLAPGRGPARWYVRAIWEEHAGWFRHESTTELYEVPARAVWPELAELAGGAAVLAERAKAHVDAGRPVEALHLIDVALAADATDVRAREVQIEALELLLARTGGRTYDEMAWLETELDIARAALEAQA